LVLAPRVAWIVHVPTVTRVTVEPDTVQIDPVCELKLTVCPEFDVALTVGEVPKAAFGRFPKAMVCVPWVTVKLSLTGVAAAQLVLAPRVAWMVHVPNVTSVTVEPETVQIDPVCELKLTVCPEFDVALTVGEVPKAAFGRFPKVMVCVPWVTVKLSLTGVAAAQLVLAASVA